MRNVATSEQEDDLEHTGQTYFSHSQRQPAHLNGAGAQASRASSPWIHLKCYSYKGLQADVISGPALGLVLSLQVSAFGELGDLLISLVAGMSLASGRELLAFSYLSHLVHSSYGW